MTEQSNIAFVCHPYHRGGVTRWMADAAITAAAAGHTVYFVTVEPGKEFTSSGGRETMLSLLRPYTSAVNIISCRVNYSFEFGTELYRANVYRRLIAQGVPAGVPLVLSDDIAVWSGACALADKHPVVGVLHGDQDYYYERAGKYHEQLSLCVCVSGRIMRNVLARYPGMDQRKVTTIPCGIIQPEYSPEPQPADTINLAFIGRLTDYEKRASDLVLIATELHRQNVSFHLHIAGNSDSSAATFREQLRLQGVAEYATFHGWQQQAQVQVLLNISAIVLLTSNSEGMPLVMMEALAAGCGFTGTRVSGIEDYEHDVRAANCLTVYTVGDIADAANKIKQLAAIPAAARQQSARKLAEAEFGIDVCLARYFSALNGLQCAGAVPQPIPQSLSAVIYSRLIALARYVKVTVKK